MTAHPRRGVGRGISPRPQPQTVPERGLCVKGLLANILGLVCCGSAESAQQRQPRVAAWYTTNARRNSARLCGDATWQGIFGSMVRQWCIRPLVVCITGGRFLLSTIGHRSHALENPAAQPHRMRVGRGIACSIRDHLFRIVRLLRVGCLRAESYAGTWLSRSFVTRLVAADLFLAAAPPSIPSWIRLLISSRSGLLAGHR